MAPSMTSNVFATSHLTYANDFENYVEGAGVTIDARDDPTQALEAPDYEGVTNTDPVKFVSLGNLGEITLIFLEPVGGSVVVFEGTNGGYTSSWGTESVNVEVSSDGTTWTSIGEATNKLGNDPDALTKNRTISTLEIPSELGCIQYVKLTDTSPAPGTGDNFDVDAVGITDEVLCIPPLEICEDDVMDLIAGQHIDAGDVTIINDGTWLYVTIQTQDGWSLTESHLDFGDLLDGFPTNKKGNPKVGHFDFHESHALGTTEFTYKFLLSDLGIDPLSEETIPIAIHTVVVQIEADEIVAEESAWKQGDRFVQKGNWAMHSTYDIQNCMMEIPTEEESVTLDLGPGWDQQGTLTDGSVVIQNSDSPNWIVEFNLEGGPASTNFSHHGLDVFVDDCSDIPYFGDVSPLTCNTYTRSGESGSETHTVLVYNFGAFSTDGSGDGFSSTEILGITSGSYDIEFWIGGSVNYQSDGNENGSFGFGDTKTFTIP